MAKKKYAWGDVKVKRGYLLQYKRRGVWRPLLDWKKNLKGWSPAVSSSKSVLERKKSKIAREGLPVKQTREGKVLTEKVPLRIVPVTYAVSGKSGRRVFDFAGVKVSESREYRRSTLGKPLRKKKRKS